MTFMKRQIITEILYLEMNDEIGPNPKACLPTKLSQIDLINISIKTLSVLSGEKGLVPESLVILPFPSLSSKGLIKYLKWDDSSRRGGIGQAAIALLFQEIDDVIFYKYINQFSVFFGKISQTFVDLEKLKALRESFVDALTEILKLILQIF